MKPLYHYFDQHIDTFSKISYILLLLSGLWLLANLMVTRTYYAGMPLRSLSIRLSSTPHTHIQKGYYHAYLQTDGCAETFMISDGAASVTLDHDSIQAYLKKLTTGDTLTVYFPKEETITPGPYQDSYIHVVGIKNKNNHFILSPHDADRADHRAVANSYMWDICRLTGCIALWVLVYRRKKQLAVQKGNIHNL